MKKQSDTKTETPFEKFRHFTEKIVSVPKAELDRREQQYQKDRAKAKRRKQ